MFMNDFDRCELSVLRALCHNTKPLHQNALVVRTGMAVNTVRAAVARLKSRNLVYVTRRYSRSQVSLSDHPLAQFYRRAFQEESAVRCQWRDHELDVAAAIRATDELNHFLHAYRKANP